MSPWNTQFYRLIGPTYPPEGTLVTRQVVKSAFELPRDAVLAAGKSLFGAIVPHPVTVA